MNYILFIYKLKPNKLINTVSNLEHFSQFILKRWTNSLLFLEFTVYIKNINVN